MYDRATRNLLLANPQTGVEIGPGAYEVHTGISPRYDGYAPFMSLTGREFDIIDNETIGFPGPGHYDAKLSAGGIGGSTVRNQASRFEKAKTDLPGPGEYSIHVGSIKSKCVKKQSQKFGKIDYKRQFCAPAIPVPGQAYGYEEGVDGSLKMQPPPDFDSTLGPAFYNVSADENTTTKTYHGNFWSHMRSKRSELQNKDDLPGPGQYEAFQLPDDLPDSYVIKEPRKTKTAPRYFEEIQKRELSRGNPAPTAYNLNGQFQTKKQTYDTEGLLVEHPPFGVQSRRFDESSNFEIPAPCSYNDPRTALDALKRIRGLKRVPFGCTSVRFNRDDCVNPVGSYNFPGLAAESMKKAFLQSSQKSAFGSTAPRIADRRGKDAFYVPGPASYTVEKKPHSAYQQQLSSFSSKVGRDSIISAQQKENPGLGSYNVDQSFKKSQQKRTPKAGRTAEARQRRSQFVSTAPRGAFHSGIIKPDSSIPGPNKYQTDVSQLERRGGKFLEHSRRFVDNVLLDETPGPGAYEFSPLIQDTILKGTFNSTLNNPVVANFRQLTASTRPRSLHTSSIRA